jgi:protein-disulfide isomerase
MAHLKTPINKSDHIRGPAHAPISLVEYGDYQCPFCAAASVVVDQLESAFERQMQFVYRHFPLTEVHPYAEVAAESAEFAGTADMFWEMHAALFRNQAILSIPTIMLIAEKLRLPETMLRHALKTGQFKTKVRNDFMGGVRSGVNGTPTFFINGIRHEGAFDLASLTSAIQSHLTADSHGPSH